MHALLWKDELFAVVAFMRQGRENNMLQVRGGIWSRTATKDYFRYCLITILPESNVMSSNMIFLSDKLSKSRGNQQIFTFEKLKPENETSSQNCWQYIFCPEFANSRREEVLTSFSSTGLFVLVCSLLVTYIPYGSVHPNYKHISSDLVLTNPADRFFMKWIYRFCK